MYVYIFMFYVRFKPFGNYKEIRKDIYKNRVNSKFVQKS